MKKGIGLLCALVLALGLFGCAPQPRESVRIYAPDGAPALALAQLMHNKHADTTFHVVSAAEIGATMTPKGDADLAILPSNAAANLYNKGQKISMLGVTTVGNLYMVGTGDDVSGVADLVGKVVGNIGEMQVPDLVLRAILQASGIECTVGNDPVAGKVAFRYFASGEQLMAALKQGLIAYGVAGEPAVTGALKNVSGAKIVLDVQAAYAEATGAQGGYPQACLVVKNEFLRTHGDYVRTLVQAMEGSGDWLVQHPDLAAEAVKQAGGTAIAQLSGETAQRCKVTYLPAARHKAFIADFLQRMEDAYTGELSPIGGKLPDDAFYADLSAAQ